MKALAFVLAVVLAPMAAAQSTFTVPSWLGVKAATTYDSYLFGYSTTAYQPVHEQWLYDVADIPVGGALIKGMALRRSSYIGNTNYAATATVSVTLSVGPNASAAASTTFANNVGPNPVNVFSGILNLPQETSNSNPPFSIVIPFTAFYPYIAAMGSALVVDITCTQYTNTATTGSWYLDAYQGNTGSRTNNGSTWSQCKFSNNNYNNSISYTMPYVGGSWYVSYGSTPANLAGIGTLGLQGKGGMWGAYTLPFDLTPFGAPNCGIASDIIIAVALQVGTQPRWPTVPIPNNPALGNASFFDQALIIDPPANPLGIVSCWPSKWTIGDNIPPLGSTVYKYRDTTPPSATGSLVKRATGAQFNY